MVAAFILFLREGLEASLVISILLAALRQLGQTRHIMAVWAGVGLAVLGSLLGGTILYLTIRTYDGSTFQTVFETATYLVAVVLLTSMTFWMQRHSRTLKKEITQRASAAGSGLALGLLAFTSVGREGLESAVFTLAFALQTQGVLLILGGLMGTLMSIGLCILIYRLGYRLDYRLFFRTMGILLLFFAAGLLGDAVQNLQSLGWLPIGTMQLWSTSHILSQETQIGDLLHGLIGYSDTPTALQTATYVTFLAVAGTCFWHLTRKPGSGAAPAPAPSKASAARHA